MAKLFVRPFKVKTKTQFHKRCYAARAIKALLYVYKTAKFQEEKLFQLVIYAD